MARVLPAAVCVYQSMACTIAYIVSFASMYYLFVMAILRMGRHCFPVVSSGLAACWPFAIPCSDNTVSKFTVVFFRAGII